MSPLRHISHSRRRRVRKKHELGEFARFGFDLRIADVSAAAFDAAIAAVEAEGLRASGGSNRTRIRMFVHHPDRSCTEAEANRVAERIAHLNPRVGAFEDFWGPWTADTDPS